MRSATVVFGPGRKLARTRKAISPSRRSRLAGWIWSFKNSYSARIAPSRMSAPIISSGRMPR
jgi:hypothetical protein